MKKLLTILATVLLLAGPGMAGSTLAQGGECLSTQQTQQAIANGEIAPLAKVLQAAGIGAGADILSVRVCREGGGYVYHVAVLGRDGSARNLSLPAMN